MQILKTGRSECTFNYIVRTNQTGAMEKLREYRQKGVGNFIETLNYLLQF